MNSEGFGPSVSRMRTWCPEPLDDEVASGHKHSTKFEAKKLIKPCPELDKGTTPYIKPK